MSVIISRSPQSVIASTLKHSNLIPGIDVVHESQSTSFLCVESQASVNTSKIHTTQCPVLRGGGRLSLERELLNFMLDYA